MMASLGESVVFLISLYSLYMVGVSKGPVIEHRPYGPLMCQRGCHNNTVSCFYKSTHLICLHSVTPSGHLNHFAETEQANCKEMFEGAMTNVSMVRELPMCVVKEFSRDISIDRHLHDACRKGDLCTVDYIITLGLADVDSKWQGRPLVLTAIEDRQDAVFTYLMDHGCDASSVDMGKNNFLHFAAQKGSIVAVRRFIAEGLHIESRDQIGQTALMIAARYGHLDMFKWLLCKGSKPSVTDSRGRTILHRAIYSCHLHMVQYILNMTGIDIDATSSLGNSAIMMAAGRKGCGKVALYLAMKGARINLVNKRNNNILHLACVGGSVAFIRYILDKNISLINERGGLNGLTPLHDIAYYGNVEAFQLLQDRGGKVRALNFDSENVLQMACIGDHLDMVKYIVEERLVNVENKGVGGRTALLYAAFQSSLAVMTFLVKADCLLTAVDDKGNNILHYSVQSGDIDKVEYILSLPDPKLADGQNDYYQTPLMTAAEKGHWQIFELLLLHNGSDPSLRDFRKKSILHVAVVNGSVDMVQLIVKRCRELVDTKDNDRNTPVLLAASLGKRDIVKLLTEAGCDIKAEDIQGNNLYHLACRSGDKPTVEYVKKLNQNMFTKNMDGHTPQQVARKFGHNSICFPKRNFKRLKLPK